ncbi:MAG: SEC-C metal-binding domain-containing protein, partial [Candidatus Margulisiibacteriota bacterium]
KLWKIPGVSFQTIDDSWAQLIDRNYYPFKAGIEVSDKGDRIKQRWRNEKYEILCSNLAKIDEPKITDIIFHLYDWSGEARENLIKYITLAKQKMKDDGKSHDFSILPDCSNPNRIGISYYLLNNDDIVELREKMLALCHLRKYKSKGDIWIGLGSLKNSRAMIDMVAYGTEKWEHNTTLEEASKKILNGKGQFIRLRKIGRNEKCPCGSGLKYKKCCGKNGPE